MNARDALQRPAAALVLVLACSPRAAAQDPALPSASPVGYDDGFFLRSADGACELRFEGLFQTVFGIFGDERDPSSDVELKRMRPEFSGRLGELEFRLEPKFTEDEVELEEAWLGTRLGTGKNLLLLGRMKAPFNLEEVRSRRHIDFPRFSIVNQLAPAEDHGAFLFGRSAAGVFEYGLAAYNGTGSSDTNSSKDVAARLMVHPFAGRAGSRLENLQFGVAATLGTQEADVGGTEIENETGLPVVRFAPGTELDGERSRAGLEAAWFHGPWFLQSEFIALSQEMASGASRADVALRGGYFTLSRVLTGEARSFGGVAPDEPFRFDTFRGRGAFVLALRLSELDLDQELETPGWVDPGTFTGRIRTLSVGLNWIPNRHAIVRNALVLSRYDDVVSLDGGSTDHEEALLVEFQLHF